MQLSEGFGMASTKKVMHRCSIVLALLAAPWNGFKEGNNEWYMKVSAVMQSSCAANANCCELLMLLSSHVNGDI